MRDCRLGDDRGSHSSLATLPVRKPRDARCFNLADGWNVDRARRLTPHAGRPGGPGQQKNLGPHPVLWAPPNLPLAKYFPVGRRLDLAIIHHTAMAIRIRRSSGSTHFNEGKPSYD